MSTKRLLHTEAIGSESATRSILVWDAPVRVFHWLMVLSFAGAWLTAERDAWRLVHVTLGYTMAGLVAFRIVWGLVGTRYARFSDFVRGPASVLSYFRGLLRGRPGHYLGHNPAGALTILAFLVMTVILAGTGWATYHAVGGEAMEELHEVFANLMLVIVGVHVAGVLVSSWVHRENLVGAMVNGRKAGEERDGIRGARRGVAAVLLIAVLAFWWYQWQQAPVAGGPGDGAAASEQRDTHDDED